MSTAVFTTYLSAVLLPTLAPGTVIVVDNLAARGGRTHPRRPPNPTTTMDTAVSRPPVSTVMT